MSNSIQTIMMSFVDAAKRKGLCTDRDKVYLMNQLGYLLDVKDRQIEKYVSKNEDLLELMDDLVDYAVIHQVIKDTAKVREQFETKIMNLITPMPGQINDTFWQKYLLNPNLATNYFHQLSQMTNYLKTREIAKDIRFTTNSKYGNLQITINKSKPEKSPEEIMAQKDRFDGVIYPKCALCIENEGFEGSFSQAARQNHRLVEVNLKNEVFYFQYSPYAYYKEHSIFINKVHQPMVMNRQTFSQLMEIVAIFPQYFVGSNAELPIVGGSILSHEHYQAGKHIFPMDEADIFYETVATSYNNCEVSLLEWPASAIKIRHKEAEVVIDVAAKILQNWRTYSNETLEITAVSEGQVHNTVTPIARKNDDIYELVLVLRNNNTSAIYPTGIFHPHPHLHHIKKENIGLIEIMGLAILPARIESACNSIQKYLEDQGPMDDITTEHHDWVLYLEKKYACQTNLNWTQVIQEEIGNIFEEILDNVGVFNQSQEGQEAFIAFILSCLE